MPHLEFFEQGGSADIVSLLSGRAEMALIRVLATLSDPRGWGGKLNIIILIIKYQTLDKNISNLFFADLSFWPLCGKIFHFQSPYLDKLQL